MMRPLASWHVVAQGLPMPVEQRPEGRATDRRFAEQPAVADLLNVAGFQLDGDGEAVFELE